MDTPTTEDKVGEFRASMEDLQNPIQVVTKSTPVDNEGTIITPPNYYLSAMLCDNCFNEVFVHIRKTIPVPRELPNEACAVCEVTGHIYRPLTEKQMHDEFKRRMGLDDEDGVAP